MIRQATPDEHRILTEISFASKKYWDYPAHFFDIWQKELTITREYVLQNKVFVIEIEEAIVGYYSLVELENDLHISEITLKAGLWLEHMFLQPSFIGKGLGTKLFYHCMRTCGLKNISTVNILADPNAKGFYQKMGCRFTADYPSSIEGRTTPFLEFLLTQSQWVPE